MRITKLEPVMRAEDPSTTLSIPLFGKHLGFMRIAEVEGDDEHVLTYHKDGTLAANYILSVFQGSNPPVDNIDAMKDWIGKTTCIPTIDRLVEICGFYPDVDIAKMYEFIMSLKDAGAGGVPITIITVPVVFDTVECKETVEAVIFGNLYEYYADIEEYEIETSFENFKNSADYDGVSFEDYRDSVETSYSRTKKFIPNVDTNCKANLYLAAVLAKTVPIIQKRYNMIHYDDAAIAIAEYVSKMTYMNDDGNVVHLSITALENFFDRVKGNVRVGEAANSVGVSIERAYSVQC